VHPRHKSGYIGLARARKVGQPLAVGAASLAIGVAAGARR